MTVWPDEWLTGSPSKVCLACGERAVRPVMLGMPAYEVIEAIDAGVIDIHIGGCVLPGPDYQCSGCDAELVVDRSSGALRHGTDPIALRLGREESGGGRGRSDQS